MCTALGNYSQTLQSPDQLTVSSLSDPTPSRDEYLIRIESTATNFFDLLQIQNRYQHQPPLPFVTGAEFAGRVLTAPTHLPGGRTPKYKRGDRVFGSSQGAYATHTTCTEERLLPVPEGWSSFEAAGLFITAPTSYGALVLRAGVKKGDWVLVHAAAGGVGLAAVQVAKAFGATVIATAGTKHKREVAQRYGADFAVDYNDDSWTDQVRSLTPEGRGVDIVYDSVGLLAASMKCTAWNGRLLVIGFAGGEIEKLAVNRILLKNVSVVGVHWGMYAKMEPSSVGRVWNGLFDLIKRGRFRSTCFTDQEFVRLESVPKALKALSARETWGKVVVKIPDEGSSKI